MDTLYAVLAMITFVVAPIVVTLVAVHLRGTRDHGPDCRTCRALGVLFDRKSRQV